MSGIKPITREESFLAKLGGQDVTTPEPITRTEQFLQAIIDNGGGGGGGGGGATVLTATIDENYDATLPCTAAELYALTEAGMVIVKYSFIINDALTNIVACITNSTYVPDGLEHGIPIYLFQSNAFEIGCASGSDIPSWNVS